MPRLHLRKCHEERPNSISQGVVRRSGAAEAEYILNQVIDREKSLALVPCHLSQVHHAYISHVQGLEVPPSQEAARRLLRCGRRSPDRQPGLGLMDRLSVWSAISELESGPAIAENITQVMLQAFWSNVIKPL